MRQKMKTPGLAALLAMAAASHCAAGQPAAAQVATVTVCIEGDPGVLMNVRPWASAMFASIDVRINWRERRSCPVGVGAVQVSLCHESRGIQNSRALASSKPSERTIVVFLDRVQELNRNYRGPSVMAHVLVHEIAHVLEGVRRHSATGIMKSRWDHDDLLEMRHKSLHFAQEDVKLIQEGLTIRQARAATAAAAQ